jgi:signal transduction histidine kinase
MPHRIWRGAPVALLDRQVQQGERHAAHHRSATVVAAPAPAGEGAVEGIGAVAQGTSCCAMQQSPQVGLADTAGVDAHPDLLAAHRLRRLYIGALVTVAVLTLLAQGLVQWSLARQGHDAEVINVAGRQRMLSQRLAKAALAGDRGEVELVLPEWQTAHRRLASGEQDPHAGMRNSAAVAALFAELTPIHEAMVVAASQGAVARLLAEERRFLPLMERIVGLYRAEAETRVDRLVALELALCGLLLVVLALEARFVFRPAVRRLRQAIHARERLRRHEQEIRELAVAAAVARDIGLDLHDGLGQHLTALSFQAQALAGRLPPAEADSARQLAAGIGEAIAQARASARRLAPVDVHTAGLETALRELADATSRAAGVDCRLEWHGQVDPRHGEDLYRIAQEAVTNALRHGRARDIRITSAPGRLAISDDGQGGAGHEGVGLRSMRHRAGRLGGSLHAGPGPERGWQVEVRYPA